MHAIPHWHYHKDDHLAGSAFSVATWKPVARAGSKSVAVMKSAQVAGCRGKRARRREGKRRAREGQENGQEDGRRAGGQRFH